MPALWRTSLCLSLAVLAFTTPLAAQPAVQRLSERATADWTGGTIKATGYGMVRVDSDPRSYRRKLNARAAAMADAYRNLAEAVNGIRISNTTTVREITVTNDQVAGMVRSFVQGARPVRITWDERSNETSCEVELEAPLGTSGGFASAILPYIEPKYYSLAAATPTATASAPAAPLFDLAAIRASYQAAVLQAERNAPPPVEETRTSSDSQPSQSGTKIQIVPPDTESLKRTNNDLANSISGAVGELTKNLGVATPTPQRTPVEAAAAVATAAPTAPGEPSGVLFDARTVGYTWNLFPQVKTENDFQIFDTTTMRADAAVGFYSPFALSIETGSQHDRTRTEPLIIEAKRVEGSTIVISNEDGKKLLQLNREADVLAKGRVLFVIVEPEE